MYTCVACMEWLPQPAAAIIYGSQICQSCFEDGVRPALKRYLTNEQDPPLWAGQFIDFEMVQHQFSADFQQEYRAAMEIYSIMPHHRVYCASACGRFLGQRIQDDTALLRCEECGTYTCTRCNELVAQPGPLHVCQSREIKVLAGLQGQTRGRAYQLCPRCYIAFVHAGGCNHMICEYCLMEFCYICGIPAFGGEGHWDGGLLCSLSGFPDALPPDRPEGLKINGHFLVQNAARSLQMVAVGVHARLPPGDQAAFAHAVRHDPEILDARAKYLRMQQFVQSALDLRRKAVEDHVSVREARGTLSNAIFSALQQGPVRDALRNGQQPTRDLLLQHKDVAQAERAISNAVDAVCRGVAPLITPAPTVRGNHDIHHQALRRQLTTTSLAEVCGYANAAVLQPRGCPQGFTCYVESSLSVAGGCCRLGDAANCQLPTACVAQADRTRSCDSSCSADERITKCDLASPYCYTNYWPTPGQTFLEVGCTTAQGQLEYIYSTYTGFGAEITDLVTAAQATDSITNVGTGGSERTGSSSPSETSAEADNNGNSDSGGSSSNTGAIAGGVVGGVAVLGLIAALITWIVLRNRRKERAAIAAGGGSNGGHERYDINNELKPAHENIAAVSQSSSYAVQRKPAGQELYAGSGRHEVAGYAEARELQHQPRGVPELQ
ncbi:hypothetical protein CERZMDRAFT_118837 [Cercospora zeae-maydis SCOH1-5]|uniref:RING-type domain-containing protein n=1 Tax=Cercospora zeae-maydis SCOH1-5 TaxID=717836 RepID=A0A6A6F4E0_9PEZI|nr:hypothetical protein CERZMDRAFT_118837 [Cercospora zeae-maydis SCOH1-5]